jgi:hypothetical protein
MLTAEHTNLEMYVRRLFCLLALKIERLVEKVYWIEYMSHYFLQDLLETFTLR